MLQNYNMEKHLWKKMSGIFKQWNILQTKRNHKKPISMQLLLTKFEVQLTMIWLRHNSAYVHEYFAIMYSLFIEGHHFD